MKNEIIGKPRGHNEWKQKVAFLFSRKRFAKEKKKAISYPTILTNLRASCLKKNNGKNMFETDCKKEEKIMKALKWWSRVLSCSSKACRHVQHTCTISTL